MARLRNWGEHNARMRDAAKERLPLSHFDATAKAVAVPSRTTPGRTYSVTVKATGAYVSVACNCPAGHTQAPLGSTPCHHGAVACLAMETADLLRWTGSGWTLTAKARSTVTPAYRPPAGNPCGGCGEDVDPDQMLPIGRQEMRHEGQSWHRSCLTASVPS